MNKNNEKFSPFLTPLAILLGSFVIAGGIVWSSTHGALAVPATDYQAAGQQPSQAQLQGQAGAQAQVQQQQRPTLAVDSSKVSVKGNPYIGQLSAPIVIDYWFDYQCPFCKQNEETVMPGLVKDYVDTGKVRVVFKDYQFLGPDSQSLGIMARAVWAVAPDKFYDWHKAIFDNQGREGSGWANAAFISSTTLQILGPQLAAQAGALSQSNASVFQKELDADKAEAVSFGISGTPAMVIGKTLVDGAQPYASFTTAIAAAMVTK
jgi:protein-disulfide isomerase